ncbi:MAG: ABC transporter substrate-binding protein [Nocardioides sp.]
MSIPRQTRHLTVVAGTVAVLLLLAGCGDKTGNEDAVKKDGSVDLSQVTLVVGDQKGGSKALLQASGQLDGIDYDIDWREFTSGPPLLEALNSGSIHVGGVGNTPPLFAAAAKGEFKVVQAATYGGTGDAIVVPKDSRVKDVKDLKGKKVAVAVGSSANFNLLAQLNEAGLSYGDVEVQELQPADALAAFSSGHVDAWAIWEPFTSQAELDSGAKVIADGHTLANGFVFQVASNAALDEKATATALEDYLARIAKAQVWSKTHQEEWAKVWAEETGLSEEITLAAVKKREIELVPVDDAVVDSEQKMADTFTENDLLPGEIDVASFFTDTYNEATTGPDVEAAK